MSAGAWRWGASSIGEVKRSGNRLLCPADPSFGGERAVVLLLLAAVDWEVGLRRALLWFGSSWPKISCLQALVVRPGTPLKGLSCTWQPSSETSEPFQQSLAVPHDAAALSFLGSFPSHPKKPNRIIEFTWLPWERELAAHPDFCGKLREAFFFFVVVFNSRTRGVPGCESRLTQRALNWPSGCSALNILSEGHLPTVASPFICLF